MRTHSSADRVLLASDHNVHVRIEIADADGAWQDLTDLLGVDFFESARWDESIDSPVSGGQLVLQREAEGVSLAPLLVASDANRNALGDYAPLIDGNRGLRIWTNVTAPGVAPTPGDWKLVMDGKVNSANWGAIGFVVTFSDIGQRLMDKYIKESVIYGETGSGEADEGLPVEQIIQQILDDNPIAGGAPALHTSAPTGTFFRPYRQDKVPLFEAIRNLALQIGFDLRYRFVGDNNRLSLYQPARDNEAADISLGPDEYLNIATVETGDQDIRNLIRIAYRDRETGDIETASYADAASQAAYGERFMELAEASSSNIDTEAEAQALAQAVGKDLSSPPILQTAELFWFWIVQLNDIVTLEANDVHYDEPQRIAVSSITHELSNGTGRTTISGRGKPLGGFFEWLRRVGEGRRPLDVVNQLPVLLDFEVKEQTPTTRVYGWVRGTLTSQVWVGQAMYAVDAIPADPWALVRQNALDTPPLADDVNELTLLMPGEGEILFVQVEPRGANLFAGEVRKLEIAGTRPPFEWVSEITHPTPSTGKLEITIDDPRGIIDTVRFWRTFQGVPTGPLAATVSASPVFSFTTSLHSKHSVILQAQFARNDGRPDYWTDMFTLDTDNKADITRADVSYTGGQFLILVDADEDTVSLWAQEFVGGEWEAETELEYRGAGTDPRFGLLEGDVLTVGNRLFRVYGKNDAGEAGIYREVEVTPRSDTVGAPGVNLDYDDNGVVDAYVSGNSNTQSFKYLASTEDMPTDAEVRATAAVNATSLALMAIATIALLGACYFKVVGYSDADGAGEESPFASAVIQRIDTIAAPDVSLGDPDEDGDVALAISGHSGTQSIKYATNASAYPSLATVRAATAVNASHLETVLDVNLAFGDKLFITALAFNSTDGDDTESPPARANVSRQNKESVKVLNIPGMLFITDGADPPLDVDNFFRGESYIESLGLETINAGYEFWLPTGATITGIAAELYCNGTPSEEVFAGVALYKKDGTWRGIGTLIASIGSVASGWSLRSDAALDELVTDYAYRLNLGLSDGSRLANVKITYTVPNLGIGI